MEQARPGVIWDVAESMAKYDPMRMRTTLVIVGMLALAGCGVIYTVPGVAERATSAQGYKTDYDVHVVELTYEIAAGANLETYIPARLPFAFRPDAAKAVAMGEAAAPNMPSLPPLVPVKVTEPDVITDSLPPKSDPQPYRIGVGDVLLLAVNQPVDLNALPGLIAAQANRQGYTVQDDGAISVPKAGHIRVGGLTLREAERVIFRALVDAGIDPSFSLEVSEFHAHHVLIGGMVGATTLVPITLRPLRLGEALALAGGVTAQDPSFTTIRIFRGSETYRIGLEHFLNDQTLTQILLQDGDNIYVGSSYDAEAAQKLFDQQMLVRTAKLQSLTDDRALFEQRLSHGAIEQPYAFLTGEVGRPIEIPLPFDRTMSLADALFNKSGGGVNSLVADYSQIYVLRRETDPRKAGGITAYHLDAENIANLAVAVQFQMHPNDIIFVATQPVTIWNRVWSQIVFPQILQPLQAQALP